MIPTRYAIWYRYSVGQTRRYGHVGNPTTLFDDQATAQRVADALAGYLVGYTCEVVVGPKSDGR